MLLNNLGLDFTCNRRYLSLLQVPIIMILTVCYQIPHYIHTILIMLCEGFQTTSVTITVSMNHAPESKVSITLTIMQ